MLTTGRAFGPWSKRYLRFAGIMLVVLTLGFFARQLAAQTLDYTGSALTQDFNTLGSSGTGLTWSNGTTLTGWYAYNKTPADLTTYLATDGTSSTGSLVSYGVASSGNRALGSLGSGGAIGEARPAVR